VVWHGQWLVGDIRGKGPMMSIGLVRDREKKTPAAEETKNS
jgi:4-aminobutyrate aminotransferase-like enzyme